MRRPSHCPVCGVGLSSETTFQSAVIAGGNWPIQRRLGLGEVEYETTPWHGEVVFTCSREPCVDSARLVADISRRVEEACETLFGVRL